MKHTFGGFKLDYNSECPNAGVGCSGLISGKVFCYEIIGGMNKWFTGCETHTKLYLELCKSGIYKLVHDPDNNYSLYKSIKKTNYGDFSVVYGLGSLGSLGSLKVPEIPKGAPEAPETKIKLGLNPGLYHIVYRFGSRSYHFCTYADSENLAKEKVIKEESINFDQDFSMEIRNGKANLVLSGVWKNGY
jgi:hypothetical protein